MRYPKDDLVGLERGFLKVIAFTEYKKYQSWWKCQCRCGKVVEFRRSHLTRHNHVKSCGCFNKEATHLASWKGVGQLGLDRWNHYVKSAERRGIVFHVSIEQGWDLYQQQNGLCALSGVPIYFATNGNKKNRTTMTASFDRKDSSKVYTVDNSQWIHKVVNIMKNVIPESEFITWCRTVAKHTANTSHDLDRSLLDNSLRLRSCANK